MSESAVTLKKLEALQALGDGRATKIVVPTELAGVVSDLSIKGEALNITKDIDQSPKEPRTEHVPDKCCEEDGRSEVTKKQVAEGSVRVSNRHNE